MARLYANENFPYAAVQELRRLGHDVLTSNEAAQANQAIPDEEVLQFAIDAHRTVVTLNRKHFIRLHRATESHAGIIVCTQDNDFIGLATRVHEALTIQPSMNGQLIRVNRPNPPRPNAED